MESPKHEDMGMYKAILYSNIVGTEVFTVIEHRQYTRLLDIAKEVLARDDHVVYATIGMVNSNGGFIPYRELMEPPIKRIRRWVRELWEYCRRG